MAEITNITWLKTALTAKYPDIVKNSGADLDNNGRIDGSEKFGDLNGNGRVGDDGDFWQYFERNKEIISREVQSISWGRSIPPKNIIHTIFSIEAEIVPPATIEKAYQVMAKIFDRVKARTGYLGHLKPEEKLRLIQEILTEEIGLKYGKSVNFLSEGLSDSNIDCDTGSFIYLALADEFHWPLYAVHVPGHVFLRWEGSNNRLNFDQGNINPDQHYIDEYNIARISIKNGAYLCNLSSEKVFGLVLYNLKNEKSDAADWNGTIKILEEAKARFPEDPSNYYALANAKAHLGEEADSLKNFNRAIQLDPNFTQAYYYRGRARKELGDKNGAIEDLRKVLSIGPLRRSDDERYYTCGDAAIRLWRITDEIGYLENAIKTFDKHKQHKPDDTEASFDCGHSKFLLGEALDQSGDRAKAAVYLYEAYIDLKEYIRRVPKNPEVYYWCGLSQSTLGKLSRIAGDMTGAVAHYKEADKYYKGALRVDPNYYTAEDSRQSVKEAIKAVYYYQNGLHEYRMGHLEDAIGCFNRSIKLNARFSLSYYSRGIAQRRSGEILGFMGLRGIAESTLCKAISDMNHALIENPEPEQTQIELGTAYYELAQLEMKSEKRDAAVQHFVKSIECFNACTADKYFLALPTDVLYLRGMAKFELGSISDSPKYFEQAVEDFELALCNNSSMRKALIKRMEIKKLLGDEKGATESVDQILSRHGITLIHLQ